MTKNELNLLIGSYEGKLRKLRTDLREARAAIRALTRSEASLRRERDDACFTSAQAQQLVHKQTEALNETQFLVAYYQDGNNALTKRLSGFLPVQCKPRWQEPFQPTPAGATPLIAPAPVGTFYANGQLRRLIA